jgi:hypothetical protein
MYCKIKGVVSGRVISLIREEALRVHEEKSDFKVQSLCAKSLAARRNILV